MVVTYRDLANPRTASEQSFSPPQTAKKEEVGVILIFNLYQYGRRESFLIT
jgi:hypothetical protein